MVVSSSMIAQPPDNSWSELLTSLLQAEPPPPTRSQRIAVFSPKTSNLAQNPPRRPVMISLTRLPVGQRFENAEFQP